MTISTIYCDRCAAPADAGRSSLIAETGEVADRIGEVDLCSRCATNFLAWLNAPALAHPPIAGRTSRTA